jgi:lysozyme family protein
MTTFEKALSFTLRKDIEGGYVVDSGGPTNRGITLAALLEANADGVIEGDFNGDGKIDAKDVQMLPLDAATAIYKQKYWNPLTLNGVDEKLAICAFDSAVNCGVSRAKRWFYDTVEKDRNYYFLLNFRMIHYLTLCNKNPDKYLKYKNGWLRRLNDLKKYVETL